MTTIKKLLILMLFILCYQTVSSQDHNYQINLDIRCHFIYNNHVRFSLYQDSSDYYVAFKNFPIQGNAKSEKYVKRDPDYTKKIKEKDFNRIFDMIMNLSSEEIVKNSYISEGIFIDDGQAVILEIKYLSNSIIFDMWSPSYEIKKRKLSPFVGICKEIILLAKKYPWDYIY